MSESNAASSSFFGFPNPEANEGAGSNERSPTDNESNTTAVAIRRDWLSQHGEIIMPGRCQRIQCGRRRPVIDIIFLEQGDVCMDCGYPRVPTYSPIIQCACLCLCDDGVLPPATQPDPITILDWRIARYDIADGVFNPDLEREADIESLPDAGSMIEIAAEVPNLTSNSSVPPDNWVTDLVFQGRYTRQQMIQAFGFRAYEIFYPAWQEQDEFGNIVTRRHPLPSAYNLQPRQCDWCGLIISDHHDACEECGRPLTRNDENSSIEVGPMASTECQCECDCGENANDDHSATMETPRSPHWRRLSLLDQAVLHEAVQVGLPASENGDVFDREVVAPGLVTVGGGWNHTFSFGENGRGLRVLRSGFVYSPILSPLEEGPTLDEMYEIYDL
jgi:hypothetical protein